VYWPAAQQSVDTFVAYGGNSSDYGQSNDPMVGGKIGGVHVFGGGLALYNVQGTLIGALGVSGDSSCADHNIAWRTRHTLNLDFVPAGVSTDSSRPDNIIYDIDIQPGFAIAVSASGWGHPVCSAAAKAIADARGSLKVPSQMQTRRPPAPRRPSSFCNPRECYFTFRKMITSVNSVSD
jgi:hypothetical protein